MGRLNGNIDDDLHAWLRDYSQRKGLSMVSIVEGYLRRLRDADSTLSVEGPRSLRVDIEAGLHVLLEEIGDGVMMRVGKVRDSNG